ncbi:MAG: sugar transferase [Lachnospiraceae bacterium]|nr:sugar transferase [Lachnospiraceae bacterium]
MYRKILKRLIDLILSLFVITILSPVFIVISIIVRIKLGRPVLFKQKRPGKGQKIFDMYKFRTMTDERDDDGNFLPDEERLTLFGRKLRRTSLDELPEVFNILKGDMSFVGPRPLLERYLPYYTERESHRHDVRPGLTGLAQINGRNALSWEKRFEFDLQYVEHVSFGLDVYILIKTVEKVLKKEGILFGNEKIQLNFDEEREKENMFNRRE